MKWLTRKTVFFGLIVLIWALLVVLHGVLTSVTAGKLEWFKYHLIPEIISVETVYINHQWVCCSLCLCGKETEMCITDSPAVLSIDTSSALFSIGCRHVPLTHVHAEECGKYRFPPVNFSTLKEGEKGSISFESYFLLYQKILTF